MNFGFSTKTKVVLAIVLFVLAALLATVFAKTMAMAWIVLKILTVVLPFSAVFYYIKWGK